MGRKLRPEVLNALVTIKLVYRLAAIVLTTTDRRRLDGLQNLCLRRIWNILPCYLSCGNSPLAKKVLGQQLWLCGKAARAHVGSVLRVCAFCSGSLRPASDRYVRRIGRPRLEWVTQVQTAALHLTGGWATLEEAITEPEKWKKMVGKFM